MRYAAIFSAALTLVTLGAQTSQAQIAWQGKLRDAHAMAKQEGKLMLLHFYTDNCVYCDRLEAGAFQSQSVAKAINDHFVPVKVHGGKNPQLAKMFKVNKYPTDVVVTTDGKALSHSVSPQQPQRYIAMLATAQSDHSKSKTLMAQGKQPAAPSPAAVAQNPAQPPAPAATVASTPEPKSMGSDLPVQVPSPSAPGAIRQNLAGTGPMPGSAKQNKFMLPSAKSGEVPGNVPGATAQLAGAQMKPGTNPGFEMPSAVAAPTTQDATASGLSKPELAIQGYCPVSVVNGKQWIEGKPEFGVIHLGRLYLFADQSSMDLFLKDPMPFTPMLNEIDVVRFFEEKKIVAGKREWGVIDPVHNRMYFFADEAAMIHFEKQFDRYVDAAVEVMDQAVAESNPGV